MCTARMYVLAALASFVEIISLFNIYCELDNAKLYCSQSDKFTFSSRFQRVKFVRCVERDAAASVLVTLLNVTRY